MTQSATTLPACKTISDVEKFINKYVAFTDAYSLPIALWTIGTFLWPDFDAFPYLVITSATKRSGKTRCSEIISFACSNPANSAAMTAASIFRSISEEKPTIFFDEAETISGESASVLRSVLNVGYRKGQTVKRVSGNQVLEYDTYCPKVFILIGDVYDTLKDRSIIIRMKRAEVSTRFVYDMAKNEGAVLRERCAMAVEANRSAILEKFSTYGRIEFLTDRDEEIWTPLFVICEALCPERMRDLRRIAVDMATEKTQKATRHIDLHEFEDKAQDDEYCEKLLRDMETTFGKNAVMSSAEIVEKLKEIETAPWRKFRGDGINPQTMADMLRRFPGVYPKNVQIGKRPDRKILKGYKLEDVRKALKGK